MQIKSKSETKSSKKTKKPRAPKKITERYLYNAGLYYLQRFPSSAGNFKRVMMRKVKKSCAHHKDQDLEACEKLVDELVHKCEELGLINDQAYAKGMVTSLRRAGKSQRFIQMKLRKKGLSQTMIRDALAEFDDANRISDLHPERQAALIFARKKRIGPYRKESKKDDEKRGQKELGALARAGFSYDVCRFILDMNEEELLEFTNV